MDGGPTINDETRRQLKEYDRTFSKIFLGPETNQSEV